MSKKLLLTKWFSFLTIAIASPIVFSSIIHQQHTVKDVNLASATSKAKSIIDTVNEQITHILPKNADISIDDFNSISKDNVLSLITIPSLTEPEVTSLNVINFAKSINSVSFNVEKDTQVSQTIRVKWNVSIAPPPAVNSLDLVTTGVQVISSGDDFLYPQDFADNLRKKTINEQEELLKSMVRPYFYTIEQDAFTGLYNSIASTPADFSIKKDAAGLIDLQILNLKGEIGFTCVFKDGSYLNGVLDSSRKEFPVIIPGFKNVTPTTVTINSSFPFSTINKYELANSPELLNQTVNVDGLPNGATYEVTTDPTTITIDNALTVTVTIDKSFDGKGDLVDTPISLTIELKNLKNINDSTVNVKAATPAISHTLPSDFTKEIITKNLSFENLPEGCVISVLYDADNGYNNRTGVVNASVSLSKYYKNNLLVSKGDPDFATFPITFNDLEKVKAPSVIGAPIVSGILPSQINVSNITSYLDISSFPKNVKFSADSSTVFDADDAKGTLHISGLRASIFYNDDDRYSVSKDAVLPEFTINTGFATQKPTNWEIVDVPVDEKREILASTITEEQIFAKYLTVNNLPIEATKKITGLVANNLEREGKINFNLVFSSYYDDKGLKQDKEKVIPLEITGFKEVTESRILAKYSPPTTLPTDLKILASEINEKNIADYITFSSFPDGTTFYNYTFVPNNAIGELDISLYASAYYDASGEPKKEAKKFGLKLTGFLEQGQTQIVKKAGLVFDGKLASEIKTANQLKNLIEIQNPSKKTGYPTNIMITNIVSNNLMGELKFTVILNNYYDEKGIFRCVDDFNYQPMTQDFQYTGFEIVRESTVFQKSTPAPTDVIYPTDLQGGSSGICGSSNQICTYVDTSTFPTGTTFTYAVVNPINIKGICDVSITADKWFDSNGNLMNSSNKYELRLTGFSKQEPTKVIQNTATNVSNIIASSITTTEDLKSIIEIVNPYTILGSAPSWYASNFNYNNLLGTLTVDIKLDQYYDKKGNPVSKDMYLPLIETVRITGFKKTVESKLVQNSKADYSVLPTSVHVDAAAGKPYWEDYVDLTSFPDDRIFTNTKLSPIDKYGTLTITTLCTNYYNKKGELIKDTPKQFTIELRNFATQTLITDVLPKANADNNIQVDEAIKLINDDIESFFKQYVEIVGAVPGVFEKKILGSSPDNANGILTVVVWIGTYYDENGNKVEATKDGSVHGLEKTISIIGFKKIKKTVVEQNFGYEGLSSITALDFANNFNKLPTDADKETKFKEITTIQSLPIDAKFETFELVPLNNQGKLIISYTLTKAYDENGNVQENLRDSVEINNFKVQKPSSIVPLETLDSRNYPASNLNIRTVDDLWRYFDKSYFPDGVVVSNIAQTTNNKFGTLTISFEVDKYYDVMGEINPSSKTFEKTFNGFQRIFNPSHLVQSSGSSKWYSKLPSEVISDTSILNVIFNEIVDTSSFPQEYPGLDVAPTLFSGIEAIADNVAGTVTFYVTANKYYDGANCNLKVDSKQFNVTVSGFSSITPSSIKVKSGIIPSQVTYDDLEFINFVTTPPKSLISFTNINDELGTLTVIVNNCTFYDKEGAKVTRTFKESVTATPVVPKSNKPMIIGLSVGLAILLVAIITIVVVRIFYKKSHEV